ncbi:hypothetical protein CCUS01_08427 [Colletotrichum cuscutae]|uniref:Uncharacterized protein n=1 Tax=Colletotrichum cuscutae TaxID=1209917 RepID=A0AAI9UTB5_9PEZI|nr:hypothetical protein CCUS01_08427 [Colletotrichum cuscutae]
MSVVELETLRRVALDYCTLGAFKHSQAGAGNLLSALEWGRYYYGASATTGLLPTSTLINMTFSRPYSNKEDNGLFSDLYHPFEYLFIHALSGKARVAARSYFPRYLASTYLALPSIKLYRASEFTKVAEVTGERGYHSLTDWLGTLRAFIGLIPVLEPIEMAGYLRAAVANRIPRESHPTSTESCSRTSFPATWILSSLASLHAFGSALHIRLPIPFQFAISTIFYRTPYFGQDLQTDFLPILIKLAFEQFYDFHHNLLASAPGNTWPGSHRNREATNVLGDPSADKFLQTRQFGRLSQIANHGCLEQGTPRAEASCLRHRPLFLNTSFSSPPHRRLDLIHSGQGRFMRHINESRLIALDSASIQSALPLTSGASPPNPSQLAGLRSIFHPAYLRLTGSCTELSIEELEVKSSTLDGLSFCASVSYLADLAGRTDFVIASYDQLASLQTTYNTKDLQRCPRGLDDQC